MATSEMFRKSSKYWAETSTDPTATPAHVSTTNFIYHVLHEGFVGNVPLDILEKFPGNWVFFTAFVTYAIFIMCYIGFFVWSYVDGVHQTFISLDSSAGNCEEVQKPLSGTYLASSAGVWQGNADFKFTDAVYEFQFNEFQSAESKDFSSLISTDFSLDQIAQNTANNDFATNLLVWMHYRKIVVTDKKKIQAMKFYSSPSDVFDRSTVQSGFYLQNDVPSTCVSKYTTFDATSAKVSLIFPNSTECRPSMTIFGSLVQMDGVNLHTQLHLNAHSTASAINKNIISLDLLETLAVVDTVQVGNITFSVESMYDPAYKRSDVFFCSDFTGAFITKDNQQHICFVEANGVMMLPLLAHADEYCASCDLDASQATIPCDYFGLLPFYVFFPALAGNHSTQTAAFFKLMMTTTSLEIRRAVTRKFQHDDGSMFETLCPDCGFMWVYMADNYNSVSPYRRTLPQGLHCVDSVSSTNFASLAQTSPAVLVESYYVCRSTVVNNVLNSVGISFSNTSIFAVTFLAVFLPLLFYYIKKYSKQSKLVAKYVTGLPSQTKSAAKKREFAFGSSDIEEPHRLESAASSFYGSFHKHSTHGSAPTNSNYVSANSHSDYGHFGDLVNIDGHNDLYPSDKLTPNTAPISEDFHSKHAVDVKQETEERPASPTQDAAADVECVVC